MGKADDREHYVPLPDKRIPVVLDVDDHYVVDVRFDTRVERTPRVLEIAEAFGIGLDDKEFVVFDKLDIQVKQGDIVYITGQSGSGKSQMLYSLERQMRERGLAVSNISATKLEDLPIIDTLGVDTNEAIKLLSSVGINDAYLYARRPSELSDGQRYRYRLALAIEQKAKVWVADEFMAVLDRVAAKVISYSLQKLARRLGVTLLVATTHTDLVPDLSPDLVVVKRFREKLRIDAIENAAKLAGERVMTTAEVNELLLKVM
ncbi:ABC transporter [Castellaniella sp.]|uniref:ABC transporter n=1 Tax=Castellaniella sp. TaxID=1955812 RepID=UPI002AFEAB32|nr:ABC transporter [Castellaniella sp.]